MTKLWHTGNPNSRSHSILPAPSLVRRFYGDYARAHANTSSLDRAIQNFNAVGKRRKRPITLATKPFDFMDGNQ